VPLLAVSDLRVRYGAFEAVRGLDLKVGHGEIVALLGANGAGKSSTLAAIASLARQVACLRKAAQERRILPFYQPKLDMGSGRIVGFEALMCARDAEGEIRTAGWFGAALRDAAIVREIDPLMLTAVLADLGVCAKEEVRVSVAYNLADRQLRDAGYAKRLLTQLGKEGIPPPQFEVELTETILLDGPGSGGGGQPQDAA
jgi:sensor c-di-GMP phosphodiesterase-like protein